MKIFLLDIVQELKNMITRVDHPEYLYIRGTGICENVITLVRSVGKEKIPSDIIKNAIEPVFELWPKYSGHLTYPVPSDEYTSASNAYNNAENWNALWDTTQEYGQSRMELLDFLISYFTENPAYIDKSGEEWFLSAPVLAEQ